MRPSFGDPSNSAQGRARVPGTGGGYDPDAVPGHDGRALVGRRLRETRYRFEAIRRGDLVPAEVQG